MTTEIDERQTRDAERLEMLEDPKNAEFLRSPETRPINEYTNPNDPEEQIRIYQGKDPSWFLATMESGPADEPVFSYTINDGHALNDRQELVYHEPAKAKAMSEEAQLAEAFNKAIEKAKRNTPRDEVSGFSVECRYDPSDNAFYAEVDFSEDFDKTIWTSNEADALGYYDNPEAAASELAKNLDQDLIDNYSAYEHRVLIERDDVFFNPHTMLADRFVRGFDGGEHGLLFIENTKTSGVSVIELTAEERQALERIEEKYLPGDANRVNDALRLIAAREDFDEADALRKEGILPNESKAEQRSEAKAAGMGVLMAHEAAADGTLPKDFDQWDLVDNGGWTVAHVAAANGNLPADFDQWDLANENGYTVAHMAAAHGKMPADFEQWELADKNGTSVAHTAAWVGHLPDNFDRWGLRNNKGTTVAHIAADDKNRFITRVPVFENAQAWLTEQRSEAKAAARKVRGQQALNEARNGQEPKQTQGQVQ